MPQHETDWAPLGWWMRLTAPVTPPASASFEQREWARRGRLASALLLAFLGIEAGALWLYVVVDDDHPLMKVALLVALAVALATGVLNRMGSVGLAGMLLVALADLPAVGIPATAFGGKLDVLHLGALYLLTGSELVAASVLAPVSVFVVAALNSVIVVALLTLMPRTPELAVVLTSNNGPQAYAGPIAFQFIVALVAFVWARSALTALRRADRAEELAELERREIERAHEVEEGVQQLLAIHVRMANGDFSARVPPVRNAPLWRIGVSLNTLIARLARLAEIERLFGQTRVEARRLAEALVARRMGQRSAWPALSGTPLDEVIAVLSDAPTSHTSSVSPPSPASQTPLERPSPAPPSGQSESYPALPDWWPPFAESGPTS